MRHVLLVSIREKCRYHRIEKSVVPQEKERDERNRKKAITLETAKLTTDENAVLIVSKLISDCRNKISVSLNDTWVSGNEKK